MYEEKITIQNQSGLHARPASELVEVSSKYASDIILVHEDDEINAKSIISVLSGGILPGMEVMLSGGILPGMEVNSHPKEETNHERV